MVCTIYMVMYVCSYGSLGLNKLLAAYEDKSAYALCTFSFTWGPDQEPLTFEGRTEVRC
jgi:inosine triphosphate pyrophosphatase